MKRSRRRLPLAALLRPIALSALAAVASPIAACAAPPPGMSSRAASAGFGHQVYAHYLLGQPIYGYGVENLKREIAEAKSLGFDGFALFIGNWDPAQEKRVKDMLEAARASGSFKIFLAPGRFTDDAKVLDMMRDKAIVDHPNYLRLEGRPVLNPWQGTDKGLPFWRDQVLGPLRRDGQGVYFVPWFWRVYDKRAGAEANIRTLKNDFGEIIDAYYFFGVRAAFPGPGRGWDEDALLLNRTFRQQADAAGAPYVGQSSAALWQSCKGNDPSLPGGGFAGRRWGHDRPNYVEFRGGEGMQRQWMANIQEAIPDAVIVPTWNDLGEPHYVTPAANPPSWVSTPKIASHPHRGFAELTKYYIAWYKTGAQPPITRDAMLYFYRTHPKDVAIPATDQCPTIQMDIDPETVDEVFVTTMLTSPGRVVVRSGGQEKSFEVPAGIHNLSMPFAAGPQNFELWRGETKLASARGLDIQANPPTRNFNVYNDVVFAGETKTAAP